MSSLIENESLVTFQKSHDCKNDQSWVLLNNNPLFKRTDFAIAILEDRYVFIAGGQGQRREELRSAFMYDLHTNVCTALPDLPKRYDCECKGEIMNGHFYVICNGGIIFRLQLSDRFRWEQMHSLTLLKFGYVYSVFSSKNLLFIFGDDGRRGSGITNKNIVYDPTSNTYSHLSPLPVYCYDFAFARIDNNIYIIGGKGRKGFLSTVHVFNILTESWTTAPPLPKPLHSAEATVVGQRWIIVSGGKHEHYDSWSNKTFVFDSFQQRWIQNQITFSQARMCHGTCAVSRSHVVSVGGATSSRFQKCSIEIIKRQHIIPNWEPLGCLILLRELVSRNRAYAADVVRTGKEPEHALNAADRLVQKVVTDLSFDMFREVLSYLIQ